MPPGDSGKKKGKGGIVGGLKKIGGAAVNLLGAPQQAVFKTARGLGELGTGNIKSGLAGLGGGLAELGTLGQIGGDIGVSEAITVGERRKKGQTVKLPKGLETLGNVALDPLLFTGVGAGAEAGKGLTTLAKLGVGGGDVKAVQAALKAGTLDLSKGSAARRVLESELIAGGSKAKQAEKIAKLTARRGKGGITAFVPGTELSKTVVSGETLGRGTGSIGSAVRGNKIGAAALDAGARAFKPGAELAQGLRDSKLAAKVRELGEYRQTGATTRQHDILHELDNAVNQVGRQLDAADDAEVLHAMETGTQGIIDLVIKKPELEPLLKVVERVRAEVEAGQVSRGLLDKLHKSDTYMQRLLTPEAAEVAKGGTSRARNLLASDVAGGVQGALKQSASRSRSIFPDMPAEAVNALKEAVDQGVPVRQLLNQPAWAKYVKGVDPSALDTAAKDFEALAKEIPQGAQFYKESALSSLLNRAASAERAIQAHDYVDDLTTLTDNAGNKILFDAPTLEAHLKSGQHLPLGWAKEELPYLGTVAGPRELLKEMKGVVGQISRDSFLDDFDKAMRGWTKFWKTHATTGVLGALPFATRNARSNIYLMMTEGMTPKDVGNYMNEARKFEDKVREVLGTARLTDKFIGKHAPQVVKEGIDATLRAQLTAHEYELWRAMQKEGITTRGFFDIDFSDDVYAKVRKLMGEKEDIGAIKGAVKNVLGTEGALARKGRDFNQAVETNARMASFFYNLDKYGQDYVEAARHTKKALFDYSELTEFEKKVMKNIIPFYTFMRKNLPRQLETLLENPTRIALPEKLSQAATEPLPEGAPDYQQEAGARALPGFLPLLGGQITTPDRPFQAALETISPLTLAARGKGSEAARAAFNVPGGPQLGLLKSLGEIGTGTDMFTGNGIKPGALASAQRLVGGQVPSLARLPRVGVKGVSPAGALTGKAAKPTLTELIKLLSGIRIDKPTK